MELIMCRPIISVMNIISIIGLSMLRNLKKNKINK